MAFNFNWSPLIADTERVRDMLTSALNKSPLPPIIVGDIIVNELNLGSTPPELEILEIGDLAEDRFRGIFKMSYTGDAYLTLKTRVQANPLNTYLSTRPAFASPQPLAASSGLTIPVQITLSDIRLSGFVILVFSKQKGITIVFRNDPLEKLKVSSTFDSIPFVRDYLQKTIEKTLRVLFVEDLPAIIHRLSLRMFGPEAQIPENVESKLDVQDQQPIDPFASPTQDPTEPDVDPGPFFTLDMPSGIYPTFSQKSVLRLAALNDSQRTLSLFTPSIKDSISRAMASASSREEELARGANTPTIRATTLSRLQSSLATPSALSSAASQTSDTPSVATRPTLASLTSAQSFSNLSNAGSRSRPGRKRKHRIVNLRKDRHSKESTDSQPLQNFEEDTSQGIGGSADSSILSTESDQIPSSGSYSRDGDVTGPPRNPQDSTHQSHGPKKSNIQDGEATLRPIRRRTETDDTPRASTVLPERLSKPTFNQLPRVQSFPSRSPSPELTRTGDRRASSDVKVQQFVSTFGGESSSPRGGILEQAWMQKMANEVARRVAEEKAKQRGDAWQSHDGADTEDGIDPSSEGQPGEAPPAYVS